MPEVTGLEMVKMMRSNEETQYTPVIFVTGRDRERELLVELYHHGAVDYIQKPIEPFILCSKVAAFVELQRKELRLRQAERAARAASEAKSRFLRNLSHELYTPLKAIVGFSEIMLLGGEMASDCHTSLIENIYTSGQCLQGLLHQLLDIAAIEQDRVPLQIEEFDIYELASEVISRARQEAHVNDNRLIWAPSGSGYRLHNDRRKLRQVMQNLLSNACKFTQHGQLCLEVEVQANDVHDSVLIRVRDTGIGIELEQRERIFEAFSRGDESLTSSFGGFGLGLAVARHYCRLMRGELAVDSRPGEGSVFSVTIPDLRAAACS
jgi:signal transduction histidine kinase